MTRTPAAHVMTEARCRGEVGAVTGVVGATGGLGGFFPPLVMGIALSVTGSYTIGFLLLAAVAVGALVVATRITDPEPGHRRSDDVVMRRLAAGGG